MNMVLLNQFMFYLVSFAISGMWFTYRAFSTGWEARTYASQYKPSIHGLDYKARYDKMFSYFTMMCVAATFMWMFFSALLLIAYFGGTYETS